MEIVNVHEAKTNLSKLLERVAHGERIIIGKAGKPIARLEPITLTSGNRKVIGGGFRLQEKVGHPLTPEELNRIAESKFE
jgi:prevent-host-death family protein